MRLVFVAPPFAGHFNPLLALAEAAREAGYEIRFVTGQRKFPVLRERGMEAIPLRSVPDATLEAIANTAKPVGSNPLRLLSQFRENLRLLPEIRDELTDLWQAERPSLVVADSVAPIAGLVAERLSIPWITTIATPFSIETRSGIPSYCGGWTPMAGILGHLRNTGGRAAIRGFKLMAGTLYRREFLDLGLEHVYRPTGDEAIYSPHAILGFGIRELEFYRDWPREFEMIGPLVDSPERTPYPPLPAQRPRVLVTLGTHLYWAKRDLVERVASLAGAMPAVQFVISMGRPEEAGLPGRQVAGNVWEYPFVTYASQMGEFDAVVHHGGAGVTYAAILAGIPSLVVPHDYDQFDFAARIEHHGLGLWVRSLDHAADALSPLLDRNRWGPALGAFQKYAQAYQPKRRFLEVVSRFVPAPAKALDLRKL